jgi:hypothetical protein
MSYASPVVEPIVVTDTPKRRAVTAQIASRYDSRVA